MFGTYRLVLAVLVLLSHTQLTILGVSPGFRPAAVVASIGVGALGWWIVERPTARLRYELRRRRAPEVAAARS